MSVASFIRYVEDGARNSVTEKSRRKTCSRLVVTYLGQVNVAGWYTVAFMGPWQQIGDGPVGQKSLIFRFPDDREIGDKACRRSG